MHRRRDAKTMFVVLALPAAILSGCMARFGALPPSPPYEQQGSYAPSIKLEHTYEAIIDGRVDRVSTNRYSPASTPRYPS